MQLVVRNGRIVTPDGILRGGLVAEDDVITHLGPDATLPTNGEVLDVEGKIVFLGGSPIPMREPHVPMLEPQIGWFYTACKPGRDATADQITIGYTDDGMLYESFELLGKLRQDGAAVA